MNVAELVKATIHAQKFGGLRLPCPNCGTILTPAKCPHGVEFSCKPNDELFCFYAFVGRGKTCDCW